MPPTHAHPATPARRAPLTRAMPIALAVLLALGAAAPVQAQTAPPAARYDIPAGPLAEALTRFAQQSGTAIAVDAEKVKGLRSPGLSGTYGVEDGFDALLRGSGFRPGKTPSGYVLVPAPAAQSEGAITLPPVAVSGTAAAPDALPRPYAGGQVARGGRLGVLGNRDTMDAPFNITSCTAQKIQDDQAATVADVVAGDPSVRTSGQTGGILDAFFIRGFPVGEGNLGEIAFDGVYGVAPNYRVFTEYAERIEVVKGPTALLYGMAPNSAVGGSINIVPKRAPDGDLTRFTAGYASDGQVGGHLDAGRRYGPQGELGIRFNGSYHTGDTPLDKQQRTARVGALAVDYRGERFRGSADVIEQKEEFDAPSRPFLVAAGVPVPSAPNGRRNVTQSWEWSKVTDRAALVRGEYDLTDSLTLFANMGGGATTVDRLFGTPTILNAQGNTTTTPEHYKFDIGRIAADGGLRARFDTGMVGHSATLQATRYRDWLARGSVAGRAVLSNLYTPVDRVGQAVAAPTNVPTISQTELIGVALADTLSVLNDRVQLMLGVRQQGIEAKNFSTTTGAVTASYDKSATTPMVGLAVKPWETVTVYGNYIEGLSKGDIAPATASNAGEALAPYVAKQFEAGVKVDFGRLAATASVFQITKPSGMLTGTVFTDGGEQRNRGLEFAVFGEVVPSVRLLAGVTLIDAELTKTNSAATRGKRPVGVPEVQANLGAEWDAPFVPGLTLTGSVAHTGASTSTPPTPRASRRGPASTSARGTAPRSPPSRSPSGRRCRTCWTPSTGPAWRAGAGCRRARRAPCCCPSRPTSDVPGVTVALSPAPVSPTPDRVRRSVRLLFLVQLISMGAMEMSGPFWPVHLMSFDPPGWLFGVAGTAVYVGPMLGVALAGGFWGRIGDRFGHKPMMIRALLGLSLTQLALAWAGDVWSIMALRFLQGTCAGYIAPAQAYGVGLGPPEGRARLFAHLQVSTNVGSVAGAVVGGLVFEHAAFFWINAAAAVVCAVCAVAVALLLPTGRPPRRPRPAPPALPPDPGARRRSSGCSGSWGCCWPPA